MGTDLRKAVLDGYPAKNVIGCDLFPAFFDLGHELWGDKASCCITFIQGDIFKIPSTPPASSPPTTQVTGLNDLIGKVDVLFMGSVFHLFDEDQQAELALKCAILVPRRKPGTLLFGRHSGLPLKGTEPSVYRK